MLDALLGQQHGLPVVTSTNGFGCFLDAWQLLVDGRKVAVMGDVGEEAAMYSRVASLRAHGALAWPVRLAALMPELLPDAKDLTDYLTNGGTALELRRFINDEYRRAS